MSTAAENTDEWIDVVKDLDLPVMVQRLTERMHTWLENNRQKQNKVSAGLISMYKNIAGYIQERSLMIFKENVILSTKLEDRVEHDKVLRDIAEKISAPVTQAEEKEQRKDEKQVTRRRDDHVVLVSKLDTETDLNDIRKNIKEICNADVDIPTPRDVLTTQKGQIIIKMKSREEAELLREVLDKDEPLQSRVKINIPVRRRERVLLLSVDPELGEDVVTDSIRRALEESVVEKGVVRGLSERLKNPSLDRSTRNALIELYRETHLDFEIVRKIKTKMGKVNWLIDVDEKGRDWLINLKRICVDFDRYRVVNYINIIRCFNCQAYGHYANSCKGTLKCAKCAEEHSTKDCKSDTIRCANCYFEDPTVESDHRADSAQCPSFVRYRESIMPMVPPQRS